MADFNPRAAVRARGGPGRTPVGAGAYILRRATFPPQVFVAGTSKIGYGIPADIGAFNRGGNNSSILQAAIKKTLSIQSVIYAEESKTLPDLGASRSENLVCSAHYVNCDHNPPIFMASV
jgi:hypothetical protein